MSDVRTRFMPLFFIYNTIKDPQWYVVQEGDATMTHMAASLPGQNLFTLIPLLLYPPYLLTGLLPSSCYMPL